MVLGVLVLTQSLCHAADATGVLRGNTVVVPARSFCNQFGVSLAWNGASERATAQTKQARLVLRIAAVYGEPMTQQHARELAATIAGWAAVRYLAGQASKLVPGPGWVVSGAVAAAGTWAIGRTAVAYFESGKQLTPPQLRALYRRLVRSRAADKQKTPGGECDKSI